MMRRIVSNSAERGKTGRLSAISMSVSLLGRSVVPGLRDSKSRLDDVNLTL